LRPTLWAGRLDINLATRKKHTPEQVGLWGGPVQDSTLRRLVAGHAEAVA